MGGVYGHVGRLWCGASVAVSRPIHEYIPNPTVSNENNVNQFPTLSPCAAVAECSRPGDPSLVAKGRDNWYQSYRPLRGSSSRKRSSQDSSTTAPIPKLSTQTKFMLDAMACKEEDSDQWERLMKKMDWLTQKVMGMDEVQQQLLAQARLAATVA